MVSLTRNAVRPSIMSDDDWGEKISVGLLFPVIDSHIGMVSTCTNVQIYKHPPHIMLKIHFLSWLVYYMCTKFTDQLQWLPRTICSGVAIMADCLHIGLLSSYWSELSTFRIRELQAPYCCHRRDWRRQMGRRGWRGGCPSECQLLPWLVWYIWYFFLPTTQS